MKEYEILNYNKTNKRALLYLEIDKVFSEHFKYALIKYRDLPRNVLYMKKIGRCPGLSVNYNIGQRLSYVLQIGNDNMPTKQDNETCWINKWHTNSDRKINCDSLEMVLSITRNAVKVTLLEDDNELMSYLPEFASLYFTELL